MKNGDSIPGLVGWEHHGRVSRGVCEVSGLGHGGRIVGDDADCTDLIAADEVT